MCCPAAAFPRHCARYRYRWEIYILICTFVTTLFPSLKAGERGKAEREASKHQAALDKTQRKLDNLEEEAAREQRRIEERMVAAGSDASSSRAVVAANATEVLGGYRTVGAWCVPL